MGKVFTIAEGLENLGALKTGGQGSVYKAKRTGVVITAVKLIPTPIFNESLSDKSYTDFNNEVQKLKRVNEEPNPNVVKILSSGITETGSFPFIEMEFIEGPDLEELLRPPHEPVFTVKEAIKVAEHLSNAIAHCHKAGVKHGDIKSNNVKLNIHTGNYVLLDFGLAVMSDEQRRTSLRQAGAVEFMAPEQAKGEMLFQSDVYSFGVILFELLAGQVPFPLHDKTETARNLTMVAHLETPPPELMELRRKNSSPLWNEEKTARENSLPQWLIALIYRCLDKNPEKRFKDGQELHEYILQNAVNKESDGEVSVNVNQIIEENNSLKAENTELRNMLLKKDQTSTTAPQQAKARNAKPIWLGITVIAALLIILIIVEMRRKNGGDSNAAGVAATTGAGSASTQYKVVANRAYFHNEPDRATKRQAYLVPSNEVIKAQKEEGDFVYIVFTNSSGQTSKGWVLKKDLKPIAGDDESKKPVTMDDIRRQLKEARNLQKKGNESGAIAIYRGLLDDGVPEAMYEYGRFGLQNANSGIDCPEAIKWISKAVEEGYTPAKRTLGFLYLFGEDQKMVNAYHLGHCKYHENHTKGSSLMTEAALDGDTTAQRLLDEFRKK